MYDGTKLICELAPSYRLDFLYNENDELYGFVKDNDYAFFYVRDFLQNTMGIVDSNGKFVVKYNCSAYGTVSILQDTNDLATINPFLYEGYYFDKESGLYYCHTRYYVPEWCRWLNADNYLFLSENSIDTYNLFAYCKNNPIMFWDESGNMPKWLRIGLCVLAGALIVGTIVAATVLSGGMAAPVLVGTGIGAISGGISSTCMQLASTGAVDAGKVILDMAVGGAIVAATAVFAGAAGTIAGAKLSAITIGGIQVTKAFAIGALAYNLPAYIVAPLLGIDMNGIEIGTPSDPTPKPGTRPLSPWEKNK